MEIIIGRSCTFKIPGFDYHSIKSSVSISDNPKQGESEIECRDRLGKKLDVLFFKELKSHVTNAFDVVTAPDAEALMDVIERGEQNE